MKVLFRASFARDLRAIRDQGLLDRIKRLIHTVENASTLTDISGLKKLRGGTNYYRIRIGEYRVGLAVDEDRVEFVRVLHRREIYRYFP